MRLIAVTNDRMASEQLIRTLLEIEYSIDAVILREKSKTDAEVIDLIQTLKAAGFDESKIMVHGRTDIATMTGNKKSATTRSWCAARPCQKALPRLVIRTICPFHRGSRSRLQSGS